MGHLLIAIVTVGITITVAIIFNQRISQDLSSTKPISASVCHFAVQRAASAACWRSSALCGEGLERDLKAAAEICMEERLIRETQIKKFLVQ
jgi:hypothetical protein